MMSLSTLISILNWIDDLQDGGEMLRTSDRDQEHYKVDKLSNYQRRVLCILVNMIMVTLGINSRIDCNNTSFILEK